MEEPIRRKINIQDKYEDMKNWFKKGAPQSKYVSDSDDD